MPTRPVRERFELQFTKAERDLLRKRAKMLATTEADYLRTCVVIDGLISADPDALKIIGKTLGEVLAQRVKGLQADGLVPV